MRRTPGIMRTVLTVLGAVVALAGMALWPVGSPAALADGCGRTYSSTTIATNTSWVAGGGTVCISGQVIVADGVTLTVGPGVVVKFQDTGSYLHVFGALSARGTSSNKIYFTSLRDDAVGGDTNLDGGATSPDNGNWWGLYLDGSTNHGLGDLDWAEIRYGGAGGYANLFASSTQAFTLTNSIVSRSSTDGARIDNGGPVTVTNSLFTRSGRWGLAIVSSPVRVHSSDVVSNTAGGLYLSNSGASVIRNTLVISNTGGGVGLFGDPPTFENNDVFGNGANYVTLAPPPPPITLTGASFPTVTLALSDAAVATTSPVTLTWQVGGAAGQYSLLLRAREPGEPYAPGGTLSQPGMPSATGNLYYLRPDLTWTLTETVYASPSVSGSVVAALLSGLVGEWRFEPLLRNGVSGIVALDGRTLLASDQPAILLRLNRPIANSGDRVRAELLTAAGQYPRPIKIAAWLVKPDGSQFSLPNLEPGLALDYQALSSNGVLPLLDRDMADLGAGLYRVEARAVYSDSGRLMSMSASEFSVCDTPSAVSGTVYAATGAPLGGGSPSFTSVTAFDVDDGATTASTTIGPSGAYSLILMPGRHLLSAKVQDSSGFHSATDQSLLKVGCGGIGATRNLTTTAPVALAGLTPASTARTVSRASVRGISSAGTGIPQPRSFDAYTTNGVADDLASLIFDHFDGLLVRQTLGQVEHSSWDSLQAVTGLRVTRQAMGDDTVDITQLAGALDMRFTIQLEFKKTQAISLLIVRVHDGLYDSSLYAKQEVVAGNDGTAWLNAADALEADLGPKLYGILDGARDHPVAPHLTLSVTPSQVQPGGAVTVTGTLKDADGTPAVGKTVTLAHQNPAGQTRPNVTTDSNGAFQTQIAVGDTPGVGQIDALFTGRDGQKAPTQRGGYRVAGPADLALASPKVRLGAGETAPVCATLRSQGTPSAGAAVTMTTSLGSLDHSTVTTGQDGQACATYTAGDRSGIENAVAQSSPPVTGTQSTPTAGLQFVIDGGVSPYLYAGSATVANGGITSLNEYVSVGGDYPPGIPVQFSLSGGGSLSANVAQTDPNNGSQARVYYQAPASGEGSSVVTSVAMVEGAGYTRTVTINYRPASCQVGPGVPRCYDVVELRSALEEPRWLTSDGRVYGLTYVYSAGWTVLGARLQVWQNGTVSDVAMMPVPSGNVYDYLLVADVNDSGEAVGFVRTAGGWGDYQPVKWQNGTVTRLGSGGYNSRATAINNQGDIVGYEGGQFWYYPVLWPADRAPGPDGVITSTQLLSGTISNWWGMAYDINASGTIAVDGQFGAATWKNDQLRLLGDLGGGYSSPTAISDSGYVVGFSRTADDATHGFVWKDNTMTDLGVAPGDPSVGSSWAKAVNDAGDIIGGTYFGPAIWTGGTMYDLNRMVDLTWAPLPSPAVAGRITNSGQIFLSDGGYAVLLTPRLP